MNKAAISLGLRRPGREGNHSPQVHVKVNNEWKYTSIETNVDLLSYRYFGVN